MTTNSAYANFLTGVVGARMGTHKIRDTIALEAPTTIKAGVIAKIETYQPWTHKRTADVLALHPAAILEELEIEVMAGQGVYGRAVTLHMGWGYDGDKIAKTTGAMAQLSNYTVRTCGGASDPSAFRFTMKAPFDDARSDVLKANNFPVGGKIVLHYFFTESNFGQTQIEGDRFMIIVNGRFTAYGEY